MPGKRPAKKGSFGDHFDELVKQFPHEPAVKFGSHKHKLPPKRKAKSPACVNRLLLDKDSMSRDELANSQGAAERRRSL